MNNGMMSDCATTTTHKVRIFFFSEKEYKVVIRCGANKSAVARVHRMYLVVETRAFSFDLYLLYPSRALFDTL